MEIINTILSPIIGLIGVWLGYRISSKQYSKEREDKYKFAALELRLAAHQQAFTLWWELPSAAHKSHEDSSHIIKCQKWWIENCLYLEYESRKTFYEAYNTAFNYHVYLDSWKHAPDGERNKANKELRDAWSDIMKAGKIIEAGIDRPLLSLEHPMRDKYDVEQSNG